MTGFTWKVPKTGYQWSQPEKDSSGDELLVPIKPLPALEYAPLKAHTGLFREFAGLKSDPDEVLRFANQYGSLCFSTAGGTRANGSGVSAVPAPETLAFWKAQTEALHEAVRLWDAVRADEADPDELDRVAQAIDLGRRGRVEFRSTVDHKRRLCRDVQVPTDLIGAIWAQFADAVANDRQYRRCPAPECGRWYELSPTAKGPDKNHCSVACKQRAYRHRKERALELFKDRRTVEQIAKELDTTVETVKRWLAGAPQDGGDLPDDEPLGTRPGLDL